MVDSKKRINLTIREEHSLMHEIVDNLRKKGISLSDHLCKLAIKDYTSKPSEKQEDDAKLPAIDRILDYMKNTKMDLANEIIRLYKNKKISDEKIVDIYLGILALKIQLDNTKTITDLVQLVDRDSLIHSKRDTLSSVAIDKATGALIDRLTKLKEKEDESERKADMKKIEEEKTRLNIEEFKRKHPGEPVWFRNIHQEDWDLYKKMDDYKEVEE
jgi:hypothetical protein